MVLAIDGSYDGGAITVVSAVDQANIVLELKADPPCRIEGTFLTYISCSNDAAAVALSLGNSGEPVAISNTLLAQTRWLPHPPVADCHNTLLQQGEKSFDSTSASPFRGSQPTQLSALPLQTLGTQCVPTIWSATNACAPTARRVQILKETEVVGSVSLPLLSMALCCRSDTLLHMGCAPTLILHLTQWLGMADSWRWPEHHPTALLER
jgi:hypothetical protein